MVISFLSHLSLIISHTLGRADFANLHYLVPNLQMTLILVEIPTILTDLMYLLVVLEGKGEKRASSEKNNKLKKFPEGPQEINM